VTSPVLIIPSTRACNATALSVGNTQLKAHQVPASLDPVQPCVLARLQPSPTLVVSLPEEDRPVKKIPRASESIPVIDQAETARSRIPPIIPQVAVLLRDKTIEETSCQHQLADREWSSIMRYPVLPGT